MKQKTKLKGDWIQTSWPFSDVAKVNYDRLTCRRSQDVASVQVSVYAAPSCLDVLGFKIFDPNQREGSNSFGQVVVRYQAASYLANLSARFRNSF
jgi:hypothetical protein